VDKVVFDSVKRVLWEFFYSCVRGNPSNPKDQGYRKNLTTKEEKIIYAAMQLKRRCPIFKRY
jgi:hypothetical protein